MTYPKTLQPGAKVAGYSVLTELGRGAASIIYLVQELKTKQIWALKHVHKHDPKAQRFLDQTQAEYDIGSKLDHPSLRRVHKLVKGRTVLAVKDMYLVLEYVDGISLEQRRPGSIPETLAVFHEVADGLSHMHAAGFVHADMKPNNIVVTSGGCVKIIDLGQSCKTGMIKPRIQGTPDYIAPEQVHRRPITDKTDVYNLGATLYWSLTGAHIPTAIPKGASLVGSLDDQFIEPPTPLLELNHNAPKRLADLVHECVQVDAGLRPKSMRDVADQLDLIRAQLIAPERGAANKLEPVEED